MVLTVEWPKPVFPEYAVSLVTAPYRLAVNMKHVALQYAEQLCLVCHGEQCRCKTDLAAVFGVMDIDAMAFR